MVFLGRGRVVTGLTGVFCSVVFFVVEVTIAAIPRADTNDINTISDVDRVINL